jgi:hypothetical protein
MTFDFGQALGWGILAYALTWPLMVFLFGKNDLLPGGIDVAFNGYADRLALAVLVGLGAGLLGGAS